MLNQLTDIHENWYEYLDTGGHTEFLYLIQNFISSRH